MIVPQSDRRIQSPSLVLRVFPCIRGSSSYLQSMSYSAAGASGAGASGAAGATSAGGAALAVVL